MFALGLGVLGSGFRFCSAIFALITLIVVRNSASFKPSDKNSKKNSNEIATDQQNQVSNVLRI